MVVLDTEWRRNLVKWIKCKERESERELYRNKTKQQEEEALTLKNIENCSLCIEIRDGENTNHKEGGKNGS